MASFRKRGKNWEYRIRYSDPLTGKKTEICKGGFKTKAEAEYAAANAHIDVKDGIIKKNDNILLRDYLDIWWETYKGTVKETSLRSRWASVLLIKKTFQNLKLKDLTYNLYQIKLNQLAQKYSKNYLTGFDQIVNMVCQNAIRDGYFKTNPIADAKLPRYEEVEKIDYWEPAIVVRFNKTAVMDINKKRKKQYQKVTYEKQRDLALYYCCLYAGLRPGEACALNITDYFPITHEIDINKTYASAASNQTLNTYKIYPPKTKNAYRTLPLPELAYKQIENWIRLREEYKVLCTNTFQESHVLFCKRDGSRLTPRDISTRFHAFQKRYDFPKLKMHGLRHTFASLQIQAGIDPKSLQVLMGHASIKTTLNIYAHITNDKKKENIAKFDNLINNLESGAKVGQPDIPAKGDGQESLDIEAYDR